jgi:hypothetical protein
MGTNNVVNYIYIISAFSEMYYVALKL